MFTDRAAAGRDLAEWLAPLVPRPCVVAAVAPGGVAVALPIAERLAAPLTIVGAVKLTAPVAPDLAFGALDEDGEAELDAAILAMLGLGHDDVEQAKLRAASEIRQAMERYGAVSVARYLPGAAVVLVAEGLRTGLTLRTALRWVRRHGARDVTVAVPCAAEEVAARLRREADRVVTLTVDEDFAGIEAQYEEFPPISEEEVRRMLSEARARTVAARESGLRLSFETAGGHRLSGEVLLPPLPGRHPLVVIAGSPRYGKNSPANRAVAEGLREARIGALLFDFAGQGDSQGVPVESTLDQQMADLKAALRVAERLDDVDAARLGLLGVDSGGTVAVCVAAATGPRIQALAVGSADLLGAEDALQAVTVPTLLVVGERDERLRQLNESAVRRLRGPRALEVVPRADHRFQDPAALARAVVLIVRWFSEHLARRGTPG